MLERRRDRCRRAALVERDVVAEVKGKRHFRPFEAALHSRSAQWKQIAWIKFRWLRKPARFAQLRGGPRSLPL